MASTSFNSNKKISSSKKKWILLIISFLVSIVIAYVLIRYSVPLAKLISKNLSTAELIALITIVLTVIIAFYKFVAKIMERTNYIKKSMSLNVECVEKYAIISCTISNKDNRRVVPSNVYLILESGRIPNDNFQPVKFQFHLKHAQGECDCILSKHCKMGGFKEIPESIIDDEFKDCSRKVVRLDHLCEESKHYIDPGEEFSEDVIFKLDKGVYRVMAIWTSVKDDCICALKEFVI